MRFQVSLPLTLGVTLLGACSVKPAASTVKHDAGAPIRTTAAWNWHAASDDDYATLMAPVLGLDASSALDRSNPIVQRTQFWLDTIDAALRAEHPGDFAHVPKPQAKVLNLAVPNAFVAPVPTCYNIPVELPNAAASGDSRIFVDVKTGLMAAWPEQFGCKDGDESGEGLAHIQAFVASFNASGQACQFTLSDAGALQPNSACKKDPSLAGGASGLVLMETANFVTVHAGILTLMPEQDFVSVLAHELGHYYRSHITAPKTSYDYFYTLQPNEPAHKPAPEADKQALGAAAIAATTALGGRDAFAAVPGQQVRSELFATLGTVVSAAGSSSPACAAAANLINSQAFSQTMGRFPFVLGASSAQVAAYRSFETQSLACLADLQLTPRGPATTGNISFAAIRSSAAAPTWPSWMALMMGSSTKLSQVNQLIASRLGAEAPAVANAKDAFLLFSQNLSDQDQQLLAVLDRLHKEHIGQYTTEQEADDESAEWISHLGIDPEAGVDSMRSIGKGGLAGLGGNILSQGQCETLWKNGWLGADGSYTYIPLGNLLDVHHSICFRMFNIEREIKAHSLTAAPVAVPVASGPAWSELQTLAASGLPGRPGFAPAFAPQVSPLVKLTGAMSCPYAYSYEP